MQENFGASDIPVLDSQEEPVMALFGQIKLNPGIKPRHYYASIFVGLVQTAVSMATESLVTMMIDDSDHLGYSTDEAGGILTLIFFADVFFRMALSGLAGSMYDKYGRVVMVVTGGTILGVGQFLLSLQTSLWAFILCKSIYGIGLTVASLSPLVADYVDNNYKGKANAVQIIAGSIAGTLTPVFIFVALKGLRLSLTVILIVLSIVMPSMVVGAGLNLKPGLYFKEKSPAEKSSKAGLTLGDGFRAAKNPLIALGFALSGLQSAQGYFGSSPLILWIKSYFPRGQAKEANALSQIFQFCAMLTAMFSTIILGSIMDKLKSHFKLVFGVLGASLFVFGFVLFVDDATATIMIPTISLWGATLSSTSFLAQYFVDVHSPADIRGAIKGVTSLCATVMTLITAGGGGLLFDLTRYSYIYIITILTVICVQVTIWVVVNIRHKTVPGDTQDKPKQVYETQ
jgi:MFS family permease